MIDLRGLVATVELALKGIKEDILHWTLDLTRHQLMSMQTVLNATQGLVRELRDDVHVTIDASKIELKEINTKLDITYRVVANQPI